MKKEKLIFLFCCVFVVMLTGCGKKGQIMCKEGYFLYNSKCQEEEDVKVALISLSCPNNYELNLEKIGCFFTETVDAKIDNPCKERFVYDEDKCVQTLEKEYTIVESCSFGEIVGDKCIDIWISNALISYSCSNSNTIYYPELGKCVSSIGAVTYMGRQECIDKMVDDRFEDNFQWSSDYDRCYFRISEPNIEYYCNLGTLEGDKCVLESEFNIVKNKTCTSGYISDSSGKCIKKIVEDVVGEYYCESGYTLNEKNVLGH